MIFVGEMEALGREHRIKLLLYFPYLADDLGDVQVGKAGCLLVDGDFAC